MKTFRLLDTGPLTAAENMALDETLLELISEGKSPDTIHFLRFAPKAVLVGFNQSVAEEIRIDYCKANSIHINRRITGGGAILFDESQLGWEIICKKEFFNLRFVTDELFRRLCEPVITALQSFGITAEFRPRNDIEIDGRKISGTGGTDSAGAFLFQGTMLVEFDVDTMLRSLRIPVEKLKAKEIDSVKQRVTSLNRELGFTPPITDIKAAICRGFEHHLKIRLVPEGLTKAEENLFQKKLPYFQSKAWIDLIEPKYRKREAVQGTYKADAGMIRYTVAVNLPQKRIKDFYITGDFLSFPTRALYDLESNLRGMPLEYNAIADRIRDYFSAGHLNIPGMSCDQFLKPLEQIFEKIAITRFGIPLQQCNKISVTNGTFEKAIGKSPSHLLLPYCAKLPDCDLRYHKGCKICGECSFGDAWKVGLKKGMKIISVVSFEDLQAELDKMKKAGVPAFIGCCCEPFFTKHIDDFARAGVLGILLNIDNTTCYDLDQAREAYAGNFSEQTEIDLDLLQTVLEVGHVGQ